jgi:hypothetical protein
VKRNLVGQPSGGDLQYAICIADGRAADASRARAVPDLQKYWAGERSSPAAKPGVPRVRLPAMSKAAILRGC